MQIFIKTLTGKTLTLNVNRSDSVMVVKQEIEKRIDAKPEFQRIIFAGK